MKEPRIESFQGADDQWYWSVIAANSKIVAQSEGYTTKHDAERAIESLKAIMRRILAMDSAAAAGEEVTAVAVASAEAGVPVFAEKPGAAQ